MSRRDGDFSTHTRSLLAKRAGYRCSFPGCGAPTSGPSAESDASSSETGMACHMVAASDGPAARRIETSWSAEQLSDPSNGIWMCYTHGKLIDTDEITYTIEVLRCWRRFAELRAQISQQKGQDVELTPLLLAQQLMPDYCADIFNLGPEIKTIGDAVEASYMSQIWGKSISRAIRDALIEVAQNSLTHGKASSVKLKILPRSVQLIDDGCSFNPLLLNGLNNGGGSLAIRFLLRDYGKSLYHSYRNIDGFNVLEFSWVSSQDDIRALTTCAVDVAAELFWGEEIALEVPHECKRVYLMFPPYFALSWAMRFPGILAASIREDQEVVLVGESLSDGVVETLKLFLPDIKVINFERSRE